VGLALLWAAADLHLDAPPLLVAVFAAAFLGGGVLVAVHGWKSAGRARQLAMHPHESWWFDRDWDPGGALDESGAPARTALGRAIAAAAFLLPFNAFAALQPEALPAAVIGIFDLGPALLLGRSVVLRLRRRKYGTSRLRFQQFPYFLGQPFVATLELSQRAPLVRALEVTLLCKERRLPEGEKGDSPQVSWTDVELYRATQVTRGARRLPLRFELPTDARPMGTELGEDTARRWWLRVRGQANGIRFDSTFLLPIYAPPREGGGGEGIA
jgi:hypothetical protein